jgi:hypothetical protein
MCQHTRARNLGGISASSSCKINTFESFETFSTDVEGGNFSHTNNFPLPHPRQLSFSCRFVSGVPLSLSPHGAVAIPTIFHFASLSLTNAAMEEKRKKNLIKPFAQPGYEFASGFSTPQDTRLLMCSTKGAPRDGEMIKVSRLFGLNLASFWL